MTDTLVEHLQHALGDAYTIERELEGGGMSRVFVAREHALGREVVIKVLPPDLAAGVNRDRFRREVQLAARLSHPYIVPLLHAGEDGELLWFTMPYIAGESLRTRLQRGGPLPLAEVIRLLRDVVEALAYAHSRGVVHRDIKPANILSDGQHALVTDFGVAKALNAALPMTGPGHTTSGMAIGTPAYMAPEQLAADPEADQRVDIYAVGLLAYELLSGASPFAAPSPTATMTAQLTRVPSPLHELRSDVPEAFSRLVQHCLAKSPEDRPPNAEAILAELDQISGALAAHAHRGGEALRPRASSVPLVLATIAVVVLVAGGFWWTQRHAINAVTRDSTVGRVGSGDTSDAATITKPMTHADSLAIAEAFRDQLKQLDPKYARKPPAKSVDSMPLDIQIERTDSLVRARLREYAAQLPMAVRPPAANVVPPGGTPSAPTIPNVAATVSGTRSLTIVLPGRHGPDSALEHDIASELERRLTRFGEWDKVTIDSSWRGNRAPGTGPSDAYIYLNLRHGSNDSVTLSLYIRNAAPGTSFGYNALNSDPVYRPTGAAPFGSTIRRAGQLLGQLRRLPPGQPWSQDMGRGGPSSYIEVNPGMGRGFTLRMDSLRHIGDSIRAHGYRPPPHRDSVP
ncbi:MAG TPA: serine/threonine-protein kinase [Gemmatimonadales bacterium]